MQDDGVGVHFVNFIKDDFSEFSFVDIGDLSLSNLAEMGDQECIIFVDALSDNFPGEHTFFEIGAAEIPAKLSLHDLGLKEFVCALRLVGMDPKRAFVFGMKPYSLEPRLGLSKEMSEKLPHLKMVFMDYLNAYGLLNKASPQKRGRENDVH